MNLGKKIINFNIPQGITIKYVGWFREKLLKRIEKMKNNWISDYKGSKGKIILDEDW